MSAYLISVFRSFLGQVENPSMRPTLEMNYDDLFAKTQAFAKDVIKKSSLSDPEMSTFEELQLEFAGLESKKDESSNLLAKSILIEKVFTLIHNRFHKEEELEPASTKLASKKLAPKAKSSKRRANSSSGKQKTKKAKKTAPKEDTGAKKASKAAKMLTLEGIVRHHNNCCFISSYQLLKRVRGIFDALPNTLAAWKDFSGNDKTLRTSLQKVPYCTLDTKAVAKQEDASEVIQNLLNQINYPYPLCTTNHITYDVSDLGLQLLKDENEKSAIAETHAILPLEMKGGKSPTFKKAFYGFFKDLGHLEKTIGGYKKPGSDVLEGGVEIDSLENVRKIKTKPPCELILSFKRFQARGTTYQKNNALIKGIPLDLKLDNSIFERATDNTREYNLVGAIIHRGEINGGHYTTLIQDEGTWFLCDDDEISPLEIADVKKILQHAYVLHYSK